jgi:hypothetical protein
VLGAGEGWPWFGVQLERTMRVGCVLPPVHALFDVSGLHLLLVTGLGLGCIGYTPTM